MYMIILTTLMLSVPGTAHAYFDAGTGALLVQGLVGAIAFITVFWGKVTIFIRSLFHREKDSDEPVATETSAENEKGTGVDADAEIKQ
jgi:hypothetical protein